MIGVGKEVEDPGVGVPLLLPDADVEDDWPML
jgi:hypothetical protein